MQGSVQFEASSISLSASSAWFARASFRGPVHWASEMGLLGPALPDGSQTFTLSLDYWDALGQGPVTDEPERVDEWTFAHEAVAKLFGLGDETLVVQALGHVGGQRLRVQLMVNGISVDLASSQPPKFVATQGQPVMLSPLASAFARRLKAFAAEEQHTRAEQLALIADLKRLRAVQQTLAMETGRVRLHLDQHLDSFEIVEPEQFSVRWADDGRNRVSLQLFVQGETQPLPLEDLDDQSPVIERAGRKAVLLDRGTEVVARRAREYSQVRREKVGPDVLRSPIGLIPEGIETPRLDFSQYSHRILGFEPATREASGVAYSSGTSWYQKDHDGQDRIVLRVAARDGATVDLHFENGAEAAMAANQLEEATKRGDEFIELQGHQVRSDAEQPKQLRDLIKRSLPSPEEPSDVNPAPTSEQEPASKQHAGRMRAVLADVAPEGEDHGTKPPPLDLEARVPWDVLASVLKGDAQLKPHQREGVAWLWHRYTQQGSGAVLADDMGLGKTLQIACLVALAKLTRAPDRPSRPTLIVAPVILIENWAKELREFFVGSFPGRLKELRDEGLRGMRLPGGELDHVVLQTFDVVITSYETLARYAVSLLKVDWDVVVLDEAHRIKNRGTQWSIAARGLSGLAGTDRPRKFEFAICATGTPVENAVTDLWALYDFVSPGRPFGSYEEFRRTYESQENAARILSEHLQVGSMASSLLRRDKSQVLRDFPPKKYVAMPIAMTNFQRDQERVLTRNPAAKAGGSFKILEQLQKLYQHPWLLDGDQEHAERTHEEALASSPKLAACVKLLEQIRASGEKALVFTLWTRMQWLLKDVIEQRLDLHDIAILNGDPKNRKRAQDRIATFSATPGFAVMILSPLAAGVGLNITAANHVIHYGRWWNPAKEDQATDRAYRIGQTLPVTVYYPVLHHPDAPDQGFDVKLDELVSRKRAMARQLLEPAGDGDPTRKDLCDLGLEPR